MSKSGIIYHYKPSSEAQPLYLEAIAICRRVLGENHPNTRTLVNNYATLQAQRSPHRDGW